MVVQILLLLLLCTSKTSLFIRAPAASRAGDCLGLVTRPHSHGAPHKGPVHPKSLRRRRRVLTAKRFPQLSLPQHPQQSLFFRPKNTSAGKIICQREKHLRPGLTRGGRACACRAACGATSVLWDSGAEGYGENCQSSTE